MKKRNEGDHNTQEGGGEGLSAKDLEELNRLLEVQHQAGYKALGSINVNIYKPGSQHVDKVENQYIGASPPAPLAGERGVDTWEPITNPPQKGRERERQMLEVLATEQAMRLWEKAQAAGYVDEDCQPLISRTQSTLVADAMAIRLGIRQKWKVFEQLWHRKGMRSDYARAMCQRKSLDFQDKLKRIFP